MGYMGICGYTCFNMLCKLFELPDLCQMHLIVASVTCVATILFLLFVFASFNKSFIVFVLSCSLKRLVHLFPGRELSEGLLFHIELHQVSLRVRGGR